jgi:hypothetical protein
MACDFWNGRVTRIQRELKSHMPTGRTESTLTTDGCLEVLRRMSVKQGEGYGA